MTCPYCEQKMITGEIRNYRSAPIWKGSDGSSFKFGKGILLTNIVEGVEYCKKCDCLIIRKIGTKIN